MAQPAPSRKQDDGGGAVAAEGKASPPARGARRRLAVLLAVLLALAGAGGLYWWLHRNEVSTDDAFVDGDVVAIAPQVSGRVAALHITDNQPLAQGELMIEIDPRDYEAAVARAEANLNAAKAQQQSAEADLD